MNKWIISGWHQSLFSKDKTGYIHCTKAQYPLPVREIFVTYRMILNDSFNFFTPFPSIRKQDPIHTNPSPGGRPTTLRSAPYLAVKRWQVVAMPKNVSEKWPIILWRTLRINHWYIAHQISTNIKIIQYRYRYPSINQYNQSNESNQYQSISIDSEEATAVIFLGHMLRIKIIKCQ